MKAILIIFAILFVADIVLAVVEKITGETYDFAEAALGAPTIMLGGFIALCIFC